MQTVDQVGTVADQIEALENRRGVISQKMRDADSLLTCLETKRKSMLAKADYGAHSKSEKIRATIGVDRSFQQQRSAIVCEKRAMEVELRGIKKQLRHLRQQSTNDALNDKRDIVDSLLSIEELLKRLVDRLGA